MVGLVSLWLPIVVSAVLVFVASAIFHIVLTYHRSDFTGMPGESDVLATMRKAGVKPGNYMFPHCDSPAQLKDDAVVEKFRQGPVGIAYIFPSGPPAMGKQLAQWFVFTVLVSAAAAYVAGRTLSPGAEYLTVHRVAGTVAFLCYAGGAPIESIWKGRSWSVTLKEMFDGLVYGLLTGGAFGWLWPA